MYRYCMPGTLYLVRAAKEMPRWTYHRYKYQVHYMNESVLVTKSRRVRGTTAAAARFIHIRRTLRVFLKYIYDTNYAPMWWTWNSKCKLYAQAGSGLCRLESSSPHLSTPFFGGARPWSFGHVFYKTPSQPVIFCLGFFFFFLWHFFWDIGSRESAAWQGFIEHVYAKFQVLSPQNGLEFWIFLCGEKSKKKKWRCLVVAQFQYRINLCPWMLDMTRYWSYMTRYWSCGVSSSNICAKQFAGMLWSALWNGFVQQNMKEKNVACYGNKRLLSLTVF